jgi:hypothetical protein
MALPSDDRFGYTPITERPSFTSPDGRRLALYVAAAIEHFAHGRALSGCSARDE